MAAFAMEILVDAERADASSSNGVDTTDSSSELLHEELRSSARSARQKLFRVVASIGGGLVLLGAASMYGSRNASNDADGLRSRAIRASLPEDHGVAGLGILNLQSVSDSASQSALLSGALGDSQSPPNAQTATCDMWICPNGYKLKSDPSFIEGSSDDACCSVSAPADSAQVVGESLSDDVSSLMNMSASAAAAMESIDQQAKDGVVESIEKHLNNVQHDDTKDPEKCGPNGVGEEWGSFCYETCSTLTNGYWPIRTSGITCCSRRPCGLTNTKMDFDFRKQVAQGICEADEEDYMGMCYKKCSTLTNGQYPHRAAPATCCDVSGVRCMLPQHSVTSPDYDLSGTSGCGADEEMQSRLCYKKCSLLTEGKYPYRFSALTCCKKSGHFLSAMQCLFPWNSDTSQDYDVGGSNSCPDGEEFFDHVCYTKCGILTNGGYPKRTAPLSCCKKSSMLRCLLPGNLKTDKTFGEGSHSEGRDSERAYSPVHPAESVEDSPRLVSTQISTSPPPTGETFR